MTSRTKVFLVLAIGLLLNVCDEFSLGLQCLNRDKPRHGYILALAPLVWVVGYYFRGNSRESVRLLGRTLMPMALGTLAWFIVLVVLLRCVGSGWVIYPRLVGAAWRLKWSISQERLDVFRSSSHWQSEPVSNIGGKDARDLLPFELVRPPFLSASTWRSDEPGDGCMYLLFTPDPPPNCVFVLVSSRNCRIPTPIRLDLVRWGWSRESFGAASVSRVRQVGLEVMDGMAVFYTYNIGLPVTWGR